MCYGGCDCQRCSGDPPVIKKSDRQQCSDDWTEVVTVTEAKKKKSFARDIQKILPVLQDLHRQATTERSHYYVGKVVKQTIALLEKIKKQQEEES